MNSLYGRFCIFAVLLCVPPVKAQRLPAGAYHADRERMIDIIHYAADLRLNFPDNIVNGKAVITLCPLRVLDTVSLDSWHLKIQEVRDVALNRPLRFRSGSRRLDIILPSARGPADTFAVRITYTCSPRAGMYMQKDRDRAGFWYAYTYGEGGLHANWLPIYNDVNDKFSTEMSVTVPRGYMAISNGRLLDSVRQVDGQMRFHWRQDLPHSNYLLALYVGNFEESTLAPAFGAIPLSVWLPRGRVAESQTVFSTTTRMVEFFSRKFSYRYPWDKYDQVVVPDYSIGAMEHTGITGHRDAMLRDSGAPDDAGPPSFTDYGNAWTTESIISHELAHHWFGDNLTCRNLSTIWLNESFASYLMMLWDEESAGRDQLLYDVQYAMDQYLEYVRDEHIIRPLEYHFFDSQDAIYNEQTTYLKGAAVLHMLRYVLGDAEFFRALSYYLRTHEFSNVISGDLKIAIEESTGKNLDWFFDQWVTGGGHPVFEVSYTYLPGKKAIDLSVSQVQPIVEGQGYFTLPVPITIVTDTETRTDKIWVRGENDHFLLPSRGEPRMVSFDGAGNVVAEVRFDKRASELQYQAAHDSLPGRRWAMRQMARRYPALDATRTTLEAHIASASHWSDAAEAARLLGSLNTEAAERGVAKALQSSDYRVRKAAVLGLRQMNLKGAGQLLQDVIRSDGSMDVVGTALMVMAQRDQRIDPALVSAQCARRSWYDELIIASLQACEVARDARLSALARKYTGPDYNQHVREAALSAWAACAPEDRELHRILVTSASASTRIVQLKAIQLLGSLALQDGSTVLQGIVEDDFDPDMTLAAKTALEAIGRVYGD